MSILSFYSRAVGRGTQTLMTQVFSCQNLFEQGFVFSQAGFAQKLKTGSHFGPQKLGHFTDLVLGPLHYIFVQMAPIPVPKCGPLFGAKKTLIFVFSKLFFLVPKFFFVTVVQCSSSAVFSCFFDIYFSIACVRALGLTLIYICNTEGCLVYVLEFTGIHKRSTSKLKTFGAYLRRALGHQSLSRQCASHTDMCDPYLWGALGRQLLSLFTYFTSHTRISYAYLWRALGR